MNSAQVIANYEILSDLTAQMHEAAVHGKWDELTKIEQQRSELLVIMKQLDAEVKLDEAGRQRKKQLITKILSDDADIRNLAEAWMGQLQQSIKSNRQEQRLHQTYGV